MNETPPLSYRFEADTAAMREAMVLAGRELRIGPGRQVLLALFSVLAFLMMAGGGAMIALALWFSFDGSREVTFAVMAVGGAFGAAFAFGWYDRMVARMAKGVTETPFNRGPQEMIFDTSGVILRNAVAEWRTDWGGVHKVAAGRDALGVFVSGIVLYVPVDMIGDRAAVKALAERLEAWREAAG